MRIHDSEAVERLEIREGMDELTPGRIVTLFRRAPLLRNNADAQAIWKGFERSQLVLTAWLDGRLVGLARVLTDGVQVSYLCDLAVEPDVQGVGVGRKLVDQIFARCKGTDLVLRDSNLSAGFYERLGFEALDNGWVRRL